MRPAEESETRFRTEGFRCHLGRWKGEGARATSTLLSEMFERSLRAVGCLAARLILSTPRVLAPSALQQKPATLRRSCPGRGSGEGQNLKVDISLTTTGTGQLCAARARQQRGQLWKVNNC